VEVVDVSDEISLVEDVSISVVSLDTVDVSESALEVELAQEVIRRIDRQATNRFLLFIVSFLKEAFYHF
jgi:hypothetical protein